LSGPKHYQFDFEFIEEYSKTVHPRETFFPDRQSLAHPDDLDQDKIRLATARPPAPIQFPGTQAR
jgi:hypothetical protein